MGYMENAEHKKRQLSSSEVQGLLKEEILQLQKELESQTILRSALEKAMNCQPLLDDPKYKSLSQPTEDLLKEIAHLELEVLYLEKYLLSMYRRNFAKRLSPFSSVAERPNSNAETHISIPTDFAKARLKSVEEDPVIRSGRNALQDDSAKKCSNILGADTLLDASVCRSQSSLSHYSASSFRASPPFEAVAEAVHEYHSLPLSMLERMQDSTSQSNLAEYLDPGFPTHVLETPNWISEEMIKCISTIYRHLSDPPVFAKGFPSASLLSPPAKSSPLVHHRTQVLPAEECSTFNSLPENCPFQPSREIPVSLVEVRNIVTDSQRLSAAEDLLQDFKNLISHLAQVDPGKLKHEEKLAFWINIHNSLAMHAFLVYGIPRGNIKRISLVLKAAYNIGGHTISIEMIQSSILGCRLPRPNQWLQSLFFPKTKFKTGDPRKEYAAKIPEPRLHFALCSGCQSDPAVRLYTQKKVFQELEMAKEDYIQMNAKLHKEQRLAIPKNVELYIKEMGLSPTGITDVLENSLNDSFMKHYLQTQRGKFCKKIDWITHNFSFRFLLSDELIR